MVFWKRFVYENAMMIELKKDGVPAVSQNVRHLIL